MYPWVFAATGGAWIAAHALGLLGGLSQYTFVLLILASMVATVVGARAFRPSHRWPFVVIMIGFFLFVAGGAARESLNTLGDLSAGRSIVPDVLTLPGYVLPDAARPTSTHCSTRCWWHWPPSRSSGRT